MASQLVHVFAFLLVINAAFGLRCYKCDSSESSTCSYGLASFLQDVVDCNQEIGGSSALSNWIPKQCVKLVAKDSKGNEFVARGCMPNFGGLCPALAKTLNVFSRIENDVQEVNCHQCDTDKCNSAAKYGAYTLLGVVMATLAFLL